MQAVGVLEDGLVVCPNQRDLLQLVEVTQGNFIAATTPHTSSALQIATQTHAQAEAEAQTAEKATTFAKNQHMLAVTSEKSDRAAASAVPLCARYERIGFTQRKCKHCKRSRFDCEASRISDKKAAQVAVGRVAG